jgi:hypothetical protein
MTSLFEHPIQVSPYNIWTEINEVYLTLVESLLQLKRNPIGLYRVNNS